MNKENLVLLLNLGTPDSPKVSDVRRYLTQFLNDPRVIDLPYLLRKILVNGLIVPFRSFSSSKIYKKVWTDEGSPLKIHTELLTQKLGKAMLDKADVRYAMRYQNPSIESVLDEALLKNYKRIIVFPLFPQYASSSTGSALEEVYRVISKWWVIPDVQSISQYFEEESYLNAMANIGKQFTFSDYDHIIMSYHGLPERHVDKVYKTGLCSDRDCKHEYNAENKFCYKAACYQTSRLLSAKLGLNENDYTVSFQSRLDKKWLRPFSDELVRDLAKQGKKKLLVFSPAFTADCLETIYEIGEEYQEIFEEHGGEKIQLVPALNSGDEWVESIKSIIEKNFVL